MHIIELVTSMARAAHSGLQNAGAAISLGHCYEIAASCLGHKSYAALKSYTQHNGDADFGEDCFFYVDNVHLRTRLVDLGYADVKAQAIWRVLESEFIEFGAVSLYLSDHELQESFDNREVFEADLEDDPAVEMAITLSNSTPMMWFATAKIGCATDSSEMLLEVDAGASFGHDDCSLDVAAKFRIPRRKHHFFRWEDLELVEVAGIELKTGKVRS